MAPETAETPRHSPQDGMAAILKDATVAALISLALALPLFGFRIVGFGSGEGLALEERWGLVAICVAAVFVGRVLLNLILTQRRDIAEVTEHIARGLARIRPFAVPAVGALLLAAALAWPMLVQMVALPLAMQTQRILISHLTEGDQLAQFNLASQLFGVILQTIAAAGLALWPIYAAARAKGRIESPLMTSLGFMGGGLVLAAALAVVTPWVVAFVTGGAFALDGWLVGGFVAFVALQAAKYPTGMYMTDERGLRFQVVPVLVMVPLTLGLSWWLIGAIGAGGAPNLKRVIDLTRVACASQLLSNPGYAIPTVVRLLHFASSSHLSGTARRIANVSTSGLGALGPKGVLAAFVKGNTRSRT